MSETEESGSESNSQETVSQLELQNAAPERTSPDFFVFIIQIALFGQPARSEKLLKEALNANPQDFEARYYLAIVFTISRKYRAALQELESVLKEFPGFTPGQCMRVRLLLSLNKRKESLNAAYLAVQTAPEHYECLDLLAKCLIANKKGKQARLVAERMLDVDPMNPRNQEVIGSASILLGDNSQAIERFRRAIAMDPTSWVAANGLGAALLNAGKSKEAVETLYRASRLNPCPITHKLLFHSAERYFSRTTSLILISLCVTAKVLDISFGPDHNQLSGYLGLFGLPSVLVFGLWYRRRQMKRLAPEIVSAYHKELRMINGRTAKQFMPFAILIASLGVWGFLDAHMRPTQNASLVVAEAVCAIVSVVGMVIICICWRCIQIARALANKQ